MLLYVTVLMFLSHFQLWRYDFSALSAFSLMLVYAEVYELDLCNFL